MMSDMFDFNGDGKTSFEEQLFGAMLVMGTFDEQEDADILEEDDGADDF